MPVNLRNREESPHRETQKQPERQVSVLLSKTSVHGAKTNTGGLKMVRKPTQVA